VEAPIEEVFENHKQEAQKQKEKDKSKSRKLKALGFEGDHGGEAIL
jgi:U6 snRNA-associated Sm-like protein LSm1